MDHKLYLLSGVTNFIGSWNDVVKRQSQVVRVIWVLLVYLCFIFKSTAPHLANMVKDMWVSVSWFFQVSYNCESGTKWRIKMWDFEGFHVELSCWGTRVRVEPIAVMIWCKRGVRSCWNTFVRLIIIEMCCAAGRLEVLAERHVAVPGLSSPCAGNRLVPHVQVCVSRPRMHANVVGRPRGAHPYSVRRSMAGVRVRRLLRRVI